MTTTTNNGSTDPLGKRALFSPPPQEPPERRRTRGRGPAGDRTTQGVKALYSTGTDRRCGTVLVECSECRVASRVTLLDLGLRLARLSLWIPGRRYSRWLDCPACAQRAWVRVRWTA